MQAPEEPNTVKPSIEPWALRVPGTPANDNSEGLLSGEAMAGIPVGTRTTPPASSVVTVNPVSGITAADSTGSHVPLVNPFQPRNQ